MTITTASPARRKRSYSTGSGVGTIQESPRNGCGPTPEICHNVVEPGNTYWRGKSKSHRFEVSSWRVLSLYWQVHTDVELFWYMMADREEHITGGTMDKLLNGLIFMAGGVAG